LVSTRIKAILDTRELEAIEPYKSNTKARDARNANDYNFIQHR